RPQQDQLVVPPVPQPDDLQVHQVPEGVEGVPALHDGGGAVRAVDAGEHRLCRASPRGVREEPDLDRGSEAPALPRRGEGTAPGGLRRQARLCIGRRARRLHHGRHGGGGCLQQQDAEGSRRAGAEAGRALLQGLMTLSRFFDNRNPLGLLFMLPAGVLLLLFLTYPLGLGTWLGFTDAKIGRSGEWVGVDNFKYLVGDQVARLSLFNTLFYTIVASVIKFALGLWLALLLNRNLPFKSFFR